MSETSTISWTDGTWNPWYGCDKVGPECENCYIGRTLRRQGLEPWGHAYRAKTTWSLPLRMQKHAEIEGRRKKLFTCSLSDFFHRKADPWRAEAWEIIRQCPDVDLAECMVGRKRRPNVLCPPYRQVAADSCLCSIHFRRTAARIAHGDKSLRYSLGDCRW
jgi:protein gp37